MHLFLGITPDQPEASRISDLMTTHWRGQPTKFIFCCYVIIYLLLGIISVPVNMRMPGALWKSGYSKALCAKEQLLKIIEDQLKSNPSLYVSNWTRHLGCMVYQSRIATRVMQECPVKHDAMRNILIFASALIPKALASILTSFVIELARPCNVRIYPINCCYGNCVVEQMVERSWKWITDGQRHVRSWTTVAALLWWKKSLRTGSSCLLHWLPLPHHIV